MCQTIRTSGCHLVAQPVRQRPGGSDESNKDPLLHPCLARIDRTKRAGHTLLVVHHDLATAAEYFDALVLLKQRMFAFGPPSVVLHPELLSEVYEGHLRVFADLKRGE